MTGVLTQLEVKQQVAQYLDDPSNARWSDTGTPSPLELAIQLVYDDMWGEILEVAPYFNSQRDVVAVANITAPGYIALTGAGITKRFHRVQKLLRNSREYSYADPKDFVIDQANSELIVGSSYRWFIIGDNLWMTPFDSTSESVDLRYSYFPPEFSGIADGTVTEWPEGHEAALVYNAAVRLMAKGAAEDPAPLDKLADRSWKKLMSYVKRRYPGPMVMRAPDHPRDWGDSS